VKHDANSFTLRLSDEGLGRLGREEVRSFVLVGPVSLSSWPVLAPSITTQVPSTKLYSNLRGKLANQRPLTWEGWPLIAGSQGFECAQQRSGEQLPIAGLVLLKPVIAITSLSKHETTHDGFLIHYSDVKPVKAKRKSTSENDQLPLPEDSEGVAAPSVRETCLPDWVVERCGPSPGKERIIVGNIAKIQGLVPGAEMEAEICPDDEHGRWVRAPNGCGYRLLRGQWAPVPVRRARSLEGL
jgi:hypothetical protein